MQTPGPPKLILGASLPSLSRSRQRREWQIDEKDRGRRTAYLVDALGGRGDDLDDRFQWKGLITVELLEQNIQNLGIADTCEIVRADALGPAALNRCPHPAHLIFMDPPYALVRDPESWTRVRTQLERLIEHLDDTGYAVLRTPWPFYHETTVTTDALIVEDEEDSARVEVICLDEPGADIDLDIEDFFAGRPAGITKTIHLDVDLTLPNALGPETHIYGTTAVHLYMKKQSESEPSSPAPAGEVADS